MSVTSSPFFIVGSHRSGTTMLRLMLNQHSRLIVPFESDFIPEFYHRLQEFGHLGSRDDVAAMLAAIGQHPLVQKGRLIHDPNAILRRNPQNYADLVDAIFSELANARSKARWGDKTPGYVVHMDVLWSLFPGCRFVHLVRDGRDVANSLRMLSWGSRDLVKLAHDWRWMVMLGRKMGEMIPQHYMELHYESLVKEPAESLRKVCEFLGEPFEPELLSYHEHAESEMPGASIRWHRSSVSAPDPHKAQTWRYKMSKADRIIFEQIAADALQMFGYEVSPLRPTLASRLQFARYALLGHA